MKLIHQLLTSNQDLHIGPTMQSCHVIGGSFTRDSLRLWTQKSNIICNIITVTLFYG